MLASLPPSPPAYVQRVDDYRPAIDLKNLDVIWKAIPGTSQELALSCPADQILYHGSRGPGKTDTQLMRFARNVGKGYGSAWTGIIFDRDYKSLGDLIKKSLKWFNKIWDKHEVKFLASNSQLKWVWTTGEELLFRTIDDPEEYWKYHGQEFAFMGWNELTQWPTAECYDIMQSCNRTSWTQEKDSKRYETDVYIGDVLTYRAGDFVTPPIPLENFSTTNSYGVGHFWVKERFISCAESGEIVTHTTTVIDPATKQEIEVELTQCAIFGSWIENIYLSPKYIAKIKDERDPNRRKAWYVGSWEIAAGGAIDDLWNPRIHVVPRFRLPKEWRIIDRSFDNGSYHPFSVGWWAEADGTTVKVPRPTAPGQPYGANGFDDWTPAAGSLIQLDEWYGYDGDYGSNRGCKLGSTKIGEGIAKRELELLTQGWIGRMPSPGPADNKIRSKQDADNETPEKLMAKAGIFWEYADQSPGSRERRLSALRDRLAASIEGERPGLYIMANCRATIVTVPVLQRDKKKVDDVNTKGVDHAYDMVTYRIQKGNFSFPRNLSARFPN